MAQRLVYHWKHGWIPLDHYAALSKAHGYESGASKIMQKRGIGGNDHVTRTHPVGSAVRATQPGISNETRGRVVGHTEHGMVQVQYQDRHGNPVVGTFNPSHTMIDQGAETRTPHPAPHTLKPGEHATVAGQDEYGQPIHFTGTVVTNGSVTVRKRSQKTRTPMRAITVNRISAVTGNTTYSTVYVPDPDSLVGKDARAMTSAQKIKAAEIMFGTGSKQHLTAKKKFGTK